MGKPIAHVGSSTSGHSKCSPPTFIKTAGQSKVFVMGKKVAVTGGRTATHGCKDDPAHQDRITKGSRKVRILGKGIARQGDPLIKGARITSGKKKFLVG